MAQVYHASSPSCLGDFIGISYAAFSRSRGREHGPRLDFPHNGTIGSRPRERIPRQRVGEKALASQGNLQRRQKRVYAAMPSRDLVGRDASCVDRSAVVVETRQPRRRAANVADSEGCPQIRREEDVVLERLERVHPRVQSNASPVRRRFFRVPCAPAGCHLESTGRPSGLAEAPKRGRADSSGREAAGK